MKMIKHSVIFSFKEGLTIDQKHFFFEGAKQLSGIVGVHAFEIAKQVSSKNSYEYSIAMEFDSYESYELYVSHPLHELFIEKYWVSFVDDFLEIDLVKEN